ncbi:Binding-protein-dependent transport systems inner membrane component [Nitrosotalea sinensis]|uniref:Binding-protein-dependent transport systems inner membrane component n=1 Tax=Nitrosotalea sinensis TaxID=1499975 RepID=A0A2H1EIG5_9ARCH|nr:ABC transporter permease [Candidatus Nitrosotalea sinensis]SHO47561.1 Binding-protein-dependent transport systems inner membrane component [Candidatus Nitrosotalea sinensis]
MGFKRFLVKRAITMFGVLMATLLVTVSLVGSNMDSISKQSVALEIRQQVTANKNLLSSFKTSEQLDTYVSDQIKQRITALGLDQPWYSPQRIGLSMYKILTLDFGHAKFLTSDSGSSDVKDIILEKLPRTILLFTTATVIVSVLGIFLGMIVASKVNSMLDKITSGFAIISSSFPVWWVGVLMIFVFAFLYPVFPARATPDVPVTDPGYLGSLLYHMILPMITLVIIGFGSWAYLVRNFLIGILQEDFISAKRSVGINEKDILYSHALKNAAPPIVTILALSLSGSLGGAIITEAVFDWPGMGRLYFEAISVLDLPVIIGETYVLTVLFLASVFISDILYGYFDPRVRHK